MPTSSPFSRDCKPIRYAHGEVSDQWYRERSHTLENEMIGENEAQSRLTSHYTLLAPLRFHIERLIETR